jgi:hypothetical protein
MNRNKLLKNWLTNTPDIHKTLGISGDDIAGAVQQQLRAWVDQVGGEGKADEIVKAQEALENVTKNESDGMSDAERKVQQLQEIFGGGQVDAEQIKEIVRETFDTDVLPAMDEMNDKVKALDAVQDALREISDLMKGTAGSRLPIATAVAGGKNPILKVVAPYYVAGSDAPTKVCVSAPPSYGKSYSVGILGQSYDKFITHGCSGDMEEWQMLLGGCSPAKEGGFLIVDGKLSAAVRSASEGKNTLLFLDEVFRMNPTTMESMLTFLAPQRDAAGDLVYELTTKQNDGGVLETLTCKADKLHIVCATNLCEVEPPEAFLDRFLIKHVRYAKDKVKDISESTMEKYPMITDVPALAERFAEAMGASRKMYGEGQIKKPLSIRDLERACIHAVGTSAGGACSGDDVSEWMIREGLDAMLMWNSDTGDIIEDSEQGVKDICSLLEAPAI